MKILKLDLVKFGPFTAREIDVGAGKEGLHVIYGPNEAGKSSALRALRGLLFGIPERTVDDFIHAHSDLRVGGRIRVPGGAEVECLRRKGRKNTLLDPDGKPMAEQFLSEALGGVDEPLFSSLFGIDHAGLVSGGHTLLAERGREAEALFGSSLGSTAVHSELKRLQQTADELFKPSAQKPKINLLLSQFAENEKVLREKSLLTSAWTEARRRVQRLERELASMGEELAEANKRRETLQRIRRSLGNLRLRDQSLAALEALGAVPALADDFAARRKDLADRQRRALAGQRQTTAELVRLTEKLRELTFSEPLLEAAEAIDDLRERLGSYRKARRDRPGLEARLQSDSKAAQNMLHSLRAGLGPEQVDALRPIVARRRRIIQSGMKKKVLDAAVSASKRALKAVEDKLTGCRKELEAVPEAKATISLKKAVDAARRSGDLDAAIADAEKSLALQDKARERELHKLGTWQGTVAGILEAQFPSELTINEFANRFHAFERQVEKRNEQREAAQETRDEAARMLRALELAGAVPTEEELTQIRERRQHGWQLVKRHWLEDADCGQETTEFAGEQPLAEAYETVVEKADTVADRLRRESQAVVERAKAQAALESAGEAMLAAEKEIQQVGESRQLVQNEWEELWRPSQVAPLAPKEMAAWLGRAEALRTRLEQGRQSGSQIGDMQEKRRQHLNALSNALAEMQVLPEGLSEGRLEDILVVAEEELATLVEHSARRKALVREISQLEESTRKAHEEHEQSQAGRQLWATEWAKTITELGLTTDADADDVTDYLEGLDTGIKQLDGAAELAERLKGIDAESRDFEESANELLAKVAPDLCERSAEEAVPLLATRLAEQQQIRARFDETNQQAEKGADNLKQAELEIQATTGDLAVLCKQAGCADAADLEEVERRFSRQRELRVSLEKAEAELLSNGDGLDVSALAREAESVDVDSAVAELDALDARIEKDLHPRRDELLTEKVEAERQFQSMSGSADAARLAEDSQELLSEIRHNAGNYVRARLASWVLRSEMENFRREHRDPILARASHYFQKLTCGSFAAVETEFDDSDQPVLVGSRGAGPKVRVEGLSTGTRDQLFLSLKLAALDHYLESSEPVPFIVDDILIQFDDDRARATLEALAELSNKTQVILFTHHRRDADQALELGKQGTQTYVHELN